MSNDNSTIDSDRAVAQPMPDPVDWEAQIGQTIHDAADQDSHVEQEAILIQRGNPALPVSDE